MITALLALSAVLAAPAAADDAKPYVLYNGRGASAAPASEASKGGSSSGGGSSGGNIMTAGTAPSAFGSNAVHPTTLGGIDPAAAAAMAATAGAAAPSSQQGFSRKRAAHGSSRKVRGASAVRRASGDDPPPYYSKPGALIRTEGQLPVYTDPGNARTTSVEGGSFVDINPNKAVDVGRAPGIKWGAPDTPPSVNPTTGGTGRAGGNAVTANGPAITVDNSHSNNINGNQNGGSGNGNGNGNGDHGNGGGNSTTGFDPAF